MRHSLPPLPWRLLRTLAVPAAEHPRAHLSAASGLVCAYGRVYVAADDEHHLGVFDDARAPGHLHRILPGDLPQPAAERKRHKADFETLLRLPAGALHSEREALLLLGSGSKPQREVAVAQVLDAQGQFKGEPRVLDLAPLYEPLRGRMAATNIEGAALVAGGELWLFNRGGSGKRGDNMLLRYRWRDVLAWLQGADAAEPAWWQNCELGDVAGAGGAGGAAGAAGANKGAAARVGYGFTDAAPLPASLGGGCLFTAVAEDSADSIADGACVGSGVGRLDAQGELLWFRPLPGAPKVEGIDLHAGPGGVTLCLVTDADDPDKASQLLLAVVPGW
jgi:hypothetical protein